MGKKSKIVKCACTFIRSVRVVGEPKQKNLISAKMFVKHTGCLQPSNSLIPGWQQGIQAKANIKGSNFYSPQGRHISAFNWCIIWFCLKIFNKMSKVKMDRLMIRFMILLHQTLLIFICRDISYKVFSSSNQGNFRLRS